MTETGEILPSLSTDHRGSWRHAGAPATAVTASERLRGAVGALGERGVLARLILFGEAALHHALREYMAHDHRERNHQGKGHVLLFPTSSHAPERTGPVRCRERLGGILKYYECEAA